ncbi:hypothetical protein ACWEGQ_12810, partial [Streptomyces seoulensis]
MPRAGGLEEADAGQQGDEHGGDEDGAAAPVAAAGAGVLRDSGVLGAGVLARFERADAAPWVLVVVATPQFKGCDGLRDPRGPDSAGAQEA